MINVCVEQADASHVYVQLWADRHGFLPPYYSVSPPTRPVDSKFKVVDLLRTVVIACRAILHAREKEICWNCNCFRDDSCNGEHNVDKYLMNNTQYYINTHSQRLAKRYKRLFQRYGGNIRFSVVESSYPLPRTHPAESPVLCCTVNMQDTEPFNN